MVVLTFLLVNFVWSGLVIFFNTNIHVKACFEVPFLRGLCRGNDSSFLSLSTKITVRTTRNSRDQTGTVMGREIDTISKMGRELADIMEEEVKMRITEIEETRNLAGLSSDIINFHF